jgi:hypothetical protein
LVRLIGSSRLGYAAFPPNAGNPSDGEIGTLDIPSATYHTVVRWQNGGFGAGTFAWSSNGSLAYILATAGTQDLTAAGSWELHVLQQGHDRILTTLPGMGGRGGSENDDLFLAFSPAGQYLALEETFTWSASATKYWGGGLRVWRVSDGSLVAPAISGTTMAVWAGNSLFYRDQVGVQRWDVPGATSQVLPGVSWVHPRVSPDGKWIVYSVRDSTGLPRGNVYNVSLGSGFPVSSAGRDGAIFLSPTVLWDREEHLCSTYDPCGMVQSAPTGVTFTYDVLTRRETGSALTYVADVWPRMD